MQPGNFEALWHTLACLAIGGILSLGPWLVVAWLSRLVSKHDTAMSDLFGQQAAERADLISNHEAATADLLATTTLCRAAEKGKEERERCVSLHGLAQRLNAVRAPVPDRTEEDETEPDPEGVEIQASL